MSPRVLVSFCCLLSVGSVLVVAQDNAGAAPHVAGILDCAGLHTGQSNSEPVEKPDCSKKAEAPDENVIVAGLGDSIAVQVTDLKEWVEKGPSKSDPHKIIPYLDGRPLTGNYPSVVDLAQNKLVFDLQLSSRSKGSWIAQLSQHKKHKVMFSVGLEDKNAFPSEVAFELRIFSKWVWPFVVILSLALGVFFFFAARTGILRESGDSPANGHPKAFSLARSQMAFWFLVILASYIFILVNTWDKDILPDTVLTLMGISAGTYLGAVVVDSSKRTDAENELPLLHAEQASLRAVAARTPEQVARLQAVESKIAQYSSAVYPDESHGFWTDVLSDANGVSLHRFQMLAWTGVLGILFVKSVWSLLVMPEFNATLLGLMGVSSGTYLGAKFPEQKK